jgi:Na+-driven multidrug efflux pump
MEMIEGVIIVVCGLIPLVYCLFWRLITLGVIGAALSFVAGYFLGFLGAIIIAAIYTYIVYHLVQKALERNRKERQRVYSTGSCKGDS